MSPELIQELIKVISHQEPSLITQCRKDNLTDEQIVKSYIADAMEGTSQSEDDIITNLLY